MGAYRDDDNGSASGSAYVFDLVVFHYSADAQSAAGQRLGRAANGVPMAEPEAFWHARLRPSRRLKMDLVATHTGRLRACIHT